ncbi:MAG: mechanosensitive ion channel [Nitrospira sp.]|nr:mechanosensitive ion channel [Nitrospira sp.]
MKLVLVLAFLIGLSQAPILPMAASAASSEKETQSDSVGHSPESSARGSAPESLVSDLQSKQAAADKALSELDSTSPGSTDPRLMERRSLLQQLVQIYGQHLDALRKLDLMRPRVREIERQNKEWDGFPTPPPYSIMMVDELRDETRSMRLTAQGVRIRLNMIEGMAEITQRHLKAAQEQVRQASERLEGVEDAGKRDALLRDRDLAQLHARVAAARVGMLEADKAQTKEALTEARQRIDLLERQRVVAAQQVEFTPQDYQKIMKRLDADQQALMSEMERAVLEQTARRRETAASEAKLAETQAASGSGSKAASRDDRQQRVARLTEDIELNRLQFDNADLHVDLLRQMLNGLTHERQLWDVRFATAQGTLSVAEEREAASKQAAAAKQIQGWKDYGAQQLAMVGGQITDVENRMKDTSAAVGMSHLNDMLRAYRHREDLYRRMLQRAETLLELIQNWQAQFLQREEARSWLVRAREWGTSTLTTVGNAWNVEVFTVEDTIEVEGKSITGHRSITVGKMLTAIAILLVGYWLARLLARLTAKLAIARLQVDQHVANIIRQWAFAFLFMLLVILTLLYVKIPITAFAFLGGALAIGVGFGTQNLLKNVISGLLLLLEQPLRVGDVIEVDGIRGVVTTIGLRSSTIRDVSGVETLVPNSNLLEKNLTNWTYSSYDKRYSLRVAVAAGSDARRVKELLRELAGQHGRILKSPEPYVLLDDFSEHALAFLVYYWIEFGPAIDPATVASDLRLMIEKAFLEASIVRK